MIRYMVHMREADTWQEEAKRCATVASRIKFGFEWQGMNAAAFARCAEVTQSTVSQWVNEKRGKALPAESLMKIARCTGLELEWLHARRGSVWQPGREPRAPYKPEKIDLRKRRKTPIVEESAAGGSAVVRPIGPAHRKRSRKK